MTSTAERITVNLTAKGAEALSKAAEITRDNRTDCVNKALQLYALLHEAEQAGGAVAMREKSGGEWQRLRVL